MSGVGSMPATDTQPDLGEGESTSSANPAVPAVAHAAAAAYQPPARASAAATSASAAKFPAASSA